MTNFNHSLAVLVGIDAYANGIPRLTTAVNDATRLADLLRAEHDYETLLLTEPAIGQPITSARLAALFTEELPARLGEDDRLLVYFAGHGVALDGDDGPRGYLVPQDARPGDSASMLAMTDLHAWLSALTCRHMLAILDCCFAGAFRWAATRHMGALPIPASTPLRTVNGFQAHEVVHFIGKLMLDKMPLARAAAALPEFVVKVALSHWYLRPDENDYPLVTELSFGFDANSQQDDDRLEKFPPTVVACANRLFRDVQNQAGWLAQFGSTKTAYVFEVL
jgi:hypothetical protein